MACSVRRGALDDNLMDAGEFFMSFRNHMDVKISPTPCNEKLLTVRARASMDLFMPDRCKALASGLFFYLSGFNDLIGDNLSTSALEEVLDSGGIRNCIAGIQLKPMALSAIKGFRECEQF